MSKASGLLPISNNRIYIYLNGIGSTTDALYPFIIIYSLGYDRSVLDH